MPVVLRRALKGAAYAVAFVVITAIGAHFLGPQLASYYERSGVEIPLAVRILMALIAFWMAFWWIALVPLVFAGAGIGALTALFKRPSAAQVS